MELDDLKQSWQALDARLTTAEQNRNLDNLLFKANSLNVNSVISLSLSALTLLAVGNSYGDQWRQILSDPISAWPGALLWLYSIFNIGFAVRCILIKSRLSTQSTITENALAVQELETLTVRGSAWLIGIGTAIWYAFPAFCLQMLAGPQVIRSLPAQYLLANVLFGLVVLGILAWYLPKLGPSNPIRSLLSGDALRRLRTEFEALQAFKEA